MLGYLALCVTLLIATAMAVAAGSEAAACHNTAGGEQAIVVPDGTMRAAMATDVAAKHADRLNQADRQSVNRPGAARTIGRLVAGGMNAGAMMRCHDNCHLCCAGGEFRQAVAPREPEEPRKAVVVVADAYLPIETIVEAGPRSTGGYLLSTTPRAHQPLTLRTFHRIRI